MAHLKIQEVPKDDDASRILYEEMTDEFNIGFIYIGEENTCMPTPYTKFAEDIENMEIRDSDIWVCSYPKTGTTWTQEMVWMIANNLDFEGAKIDQMYRFPFLEISALFDCDKLGKAMGQSLPEPFCNSVGIVNELQSPRFVKTHMPFSLLPRELRSGTKTPKMIYVIRNPKDTCVSYYHHSRLLQGCRASLEDFAKAFLADKVQYGSYWKHILGFWQGRNVPNLLIIKYEDMKKDLPSVIRKVAEFINKKLTDEQIEKLTEHLSFESMKKNKAVNVEDYIQVRKMKNLTFGDGSFIRAGTVGKYKEELSLETIKKLNDKTKEMFKGTDFCDQYSDEL